MPKTTKEIELIARKDIKKWNELLWYSQKELDNECSKVGVNIMNNTIKEQNKIFNNRLEQLRKELKNSINEWLIVPENETIPIDYYINAHKIIDSVFDKYTHGLDVNKQKDGSHNSPSVESLNLSKPDIVTRYSEVKRY